MITFEKLQLVKEIINQPVLYKIIFITFKVIAADLTKQQKLDADQKVIQ